jgi:hypothetical protein
MPHTNDHREACHLLMSFKNHYQKEANIYELEVKRFANQIAEIEDRLVDAHVMQRIFDHNSHVWTAIQGSGAEDYWWGVRKPKPPFTPGRHELPILPPSLHTLTIPESIRSRPPSPSASPPPIPVPPRSLSPASGPQRGHRPRTPPYIQDRTANESKRAAPSHMPKEHSPHTLSPTYAINPQVLETPPSPRKPIATPPYTRPL